MDLPGTYSLYALSAEEEAARDFICFGRPDLTVVVCDAACLERNLNLVLQILEITSSVILVVNLIDEAEKRGVMVDTVILSQALGIPVIKTAARSGKGLELLKETIYRADLSPKPVFCTRYSQAVEDEAVKLEMLLANILRGRLSERWVALKLLEGDERIISRINTFLEEDLRSRPEVESALAHSAEILNAAGYDSSAIKDEISETIYRASENICKKAVSSSHHRDLSGMDRILTKRITGVPIMLALLAFIFFITIKAANVPSGILFSALDALGARLSRFLISVGTPSVIHDAFIYGIWRVLAWVVAVMLPPMAIFFPLFTLLEDLGYLPRIAFNMDNCFRRAGACGKQALTMCMGFGCNAAGVTGCRIIDSPRERLIAIITNCFSPCNGRFPTLITMITVFFISQSGAVSSFFAALFLTALILLGIGITLLVSKLLSKTVLKGVPSSMTLELPAFRAPKVGQVLLRSVLDRTVFVLGRAVAIAAPAGLILWLSANVYAGGSSILSLFTGILDPLGRFLGMDGVILAAFILGIPANEIVLPIIIMAYTAGATITGFSGTVSLHAILSANGWTWLTALNLMLFSIMHWPCATTLMTIKKETGSLKWTLAAFLIPTLCGMTACAAVTWSVRLFGAIF